MPDYYAPLTEDQARRIAIGIGDDFRDVLVRLAAAIGGEDAPLFVDTVPNDSGDADVVAITPATIIRARGTVIAVLPLTALWKLEAAHALTDNPWNDDATGVRGPRWTLHVRGLPGDSVTLPSRERESLPGHVDELLRQALVSA